MNIYHSRLIFFILLIFLYSCANQLPPSGGKDDTIPPKLIYIFPKPNSTMVKGNKIVFKFNEYVDRRSFEESFFISPRSAGNYNFDWSGKEVEILFEKNFESDRTYVIIIGKDFKDQRGGNTLSSPVTIAFSTGSRLDKGTFSGKVFAGNYDRVKVMIYFSKDTAAVFSDPANSQPDYITQVNQDGTYEFTNLPNGKFRLYALTDEDRNNVYDSDLDKIALLPDDIKLYGDSTSVSDLNFILDIKDKNNYSSFFLKTLSSDSSDLIYSNYNYSGSNFITPEHRFYFYFKNNIPDKKEVVENFIISDTSDRKVYKPIFNWINDSLLEVFTQEKLKFNSVISLTFDIKGTGNSRFSGSFKVYEKDKFGKISGDVKRTDPDIPAILTLYSLSKDGPVYTKVISDTSAFEIDDILEGKYLLFVFIDKDLNGTFDKGNVNPYIAPENFIIYDKDFEIKGNSSIEKILLEF
ncbi:MAG: Ig-like domain-containing protein [Ignavibacteria bacterium]